MSRWTLVIFALIGWVPVGTAGNTQSSSPSEPRIPTPKAYFGHAPGAQGRLISVPRIVEYLRHLEECSDRILVREIGKTTEGHPFVAAFLSSPSNLGSLDDIRANLKKLCDPRHHSDEDEIKTILGTTPLTAVITCSIHADETMPTQWAPGFAHDLVSKNDARTQHLLDNVVVALVPCQNPDGYAKVKEWVDSVRGGPYKRSRLPFLYHKYCGHDLNRDWFAFQQRETRNVVDELINTHYPQIVFDLHQMGRLGYRFFVPPYREPIEPNVDPILITQLEQLGAMMAGALTAEDKQGVVWGEIFDAWSPARAYPHYRGAVRVLLEAAGLDLVYPVEVGQAELAPAARTRTRNHPLPWKGGLWTPEDVLSYYQTAVRAGLEHAARERRAWLERYRLVFRRAVSGTSDLRGFAIPLEQRDPESAAALVEVLLRAEVEIWQVTEPLTSPQRSLSEGTLMIDLRQPFSAFARCMLENIEYPMVIDRTQPESETSDLRNGTDSERRTEVPRTRRKPYDSTTHHLPLMMGVDVIPIPTSDGLPDQFEADRIGKPPHFLCGVSSAPPPADDGEAVVLISRSSNGSYRLVNELLRRGVPVRETKRSVDWGQAPNVRHMLPGTFLFSQSDRLDIKELDRLGREHHARIFAGGSLPIGTETRRLTAPRVGIYHSFVPNADAGWTRFVLDRYGFHNEAYTGRDIDGLDPRTVDVVIIPHQHPSDLAGGLSGENVPTEYRGGLGEERMNTLLRFAKRGGTVVVFGDSTRAFLDALRRGTSPGNRLKDVFRSQRGKQVYSPGALVAVKNSPSKPLGYGLPQLVPAFLWGGTAFSGPSELIPARYHETQVRLAGWMEGEWILADQGAIADVAVGAGRVVLFGFRPQFRSQMRGTFKFVFNAILRSVK